MDKLNLIIGLLASAVTVLGFASGVFQRAWKAILRTGRESESSPLYKIPRTTVRVLVTGERSCWWHMGKAGDAPTMQVVARFTVTNITRYNIRLPLGKIRKPRILGYCTVKNVDSPLHGQYAIPPGATTEVSLDFWISPPMRKEGEDLVGDLAVVDQFGNEHWLRKVRFIYG
jgi:hypothetical protein